MKLSEFIDTHVLSDPEWADAYLAADATREAGRALVRARLAAGLTQQELARRSSTAQAVISRIERGAVSPSLDTFGKIAKGLGMVPVIGLEPAKRSSAKSSLKSKTRPIERARAGKVTKSSKSRRASVRQRSSKTSPGSAIEVKSSG